MQKKKGQLTTFVLVGFVVVILIVLITILYLSLTTVSINNKLYVNNKLEELKSRIEECITKGLIDGLRAVGAENIKEYMKSINCLDIFGDIPDIKINSNKETINANLIKDHINVDYYADISLVKENVKADLGKLSYTYNLYNIYGLNNDKGADSTMQLSTFGGIGILVVPQGTIISGSNFSIGIKQKDDVIQLSDTIIIKPYSTFSPFASINIVYDNCIKGKTAIVDKQTSQTLETVCLTLNEDTYASAVITSTSDYFVGSCDKFQCCWNKICEKGIGENCNNCPSDCICSSGQDVIGNEPTENPVGQPGDGNEVDCTGTSRKPECL